MRIVTLRLLLLLIALGRLNAQDLVGDLLGGIGVEVVTVAPGSNLTFSATGESDTPITFQWRKNGIAIPGAVGPTMSLRGATLTDSGVYFAVATNDAASIPSNSVTIVVTGSGGTGGSDGTTAQAPVITSQPGNIEALLYSNIAFQVAATGVPAPTYQWLQNGVPIPGATSATLSLTSVLTGGGYSVVVSNSAGSVESRVAGLFVTNPPPTWGDGMAMLPVITDQPGDLTIPILGDATFGVTATGYPAPTFQWIRDGVPIPGANSSSLSLTQVLTSASYAVAVTNAAGTVVSRSAALSVVGPPPPVATAPIFTSHPVSQAVVEGSSVTFSVSVSGSPYPSFQWRKDGWALSGGTASTLRLDAVTKNHNEGTYDVVVWNSAGNVTSNSASLIVQTPYVPPPEPPAPPPPTAGPIEGVTMIANSTLNLGMGWNPTVAFQIGGSMPKTILVRALGPTLRTFGVSDASRDPQVELFNQTGLIARNDNWGGGSDLMQAFSQAGATPLMSGDSGDAAFLMTVSPGAYYAVVSSVEGMGGTVLVEVYEFP